MEIKEIKQQLTIKEVLNHYGVKTDKNGMAKCPFHKDKNPSMQVYPKSNTYCCFSSNCNAGTGDQIQFIELQEKQGKQQAILKAKEMLGIREHLKENKQGGEQLLGVKTETDKGGSRTAIKNNNESEQSLNDIFQKLKQNLAKSPRAKAYLKERHLGNLIGSVSYGVGFNANGYKDLQHCIIFPLKDKFNNVVSLYGRSLNKGHYYSANRKGLYPKYPAAETRKLVLTESIIDAATLLQQKAITAEYEILALYGTNGLTAEHKEAVSQLKYLQEVVIWLDGDEAGRKAAAKYEKQIGELLNSK